MVCVHACARVEWEKVSTCESGALGGQKGRSNALKLELHAAVNCLMWVLGNELGSSAKAAQALNPWNFFPVLILVLLDTNPDVVFLYHMVTLFHISWGVTALPPQWPHHYIPNRTAVLVSAHSHQGFLLFVRPCGIHWSGYAMFFLYRFACWEYLFKIREGLRKPCRVSVEIFALTSRSDKHR